MARIKHDPQKGNFCMIQTKICQADKDKLTKIADGFSMTIYQLLQALLLAIVRYFDSESIVTDEHNIMMNAFANAIFALKDSYCPLAMKDRQRQSIKKAILLIERPRKSPQVLSISKDSSGNLKESYNIETMLTDFIGSIDPESLQALCQMKADNGYFSLAQTLHELILSRKPAPADTMSEEIKQLFSDERIATGDKINEDVHYKGKKTIFEEWSTPTMRKKPVRTSLLGL